MNTPTTPAAGQSVLQSSTPLEQEVSAPNSPALRSASAHVLFWSTVAVLLTIDLWSKAWVFREIGPSEVRTIIPGVLEFRRSLNDGAVFGTFSGRVEIFIIASLFALGFVLYLFAQSRARQPVLHVALGLILAGALGNLYDRAFMIADVVRYSDNSRPRSHIGKIVSEAGEKVIVGEWPDGSSPQSYDKSDVELSRQGVVRDFIKFVPKIPKSWGRIGGNDFWPWIFNVADAALVVGVIVLLLTSIFERPKRPALEEA